ncbi:Vacuolar protein sorting/targeting protein 10 [Spathaspora sp. JA1]|nr:Vacuolar protein sorting/targeting protein 10 [Spathaspora sp. JA1]
MDPYSHNRAFASDYGVLFISEDKGENWRQLNDDKEKWSHHYISFNAANPDYLLISRADCSHFKSRSRPCKNIYYYTTDGLKTVEKLPIDNPYICKFIKSTPEFKSGNESSILCISNHFNSFGHLTRSQLFQSDDFFKSKREIILKKYENVGDSEMIVDIRIEKKFVIAIVSLDRINWSPVNLYISRDGVIFNKSNLQLGIKYKDISILPSPPSSLSFQITKGFSKIYSSDSSGLHYRENFEQNAGGKIEKVRTIGGTWIANIELVSSSETEDKSNQIPFNNEPRKIVTKYSFNNGQEWSLLKSNDEDCDINSGCSIHLLDYSELYRNVKFTPGPSLDILMGVGNIGSHFTGSSKTFISRDGGASWNKALDFPSIFAIGDQGNILLAMEYLGEFESTDEVHYSLDQGKSWNKMPLKFPIFSPTVLTTIDGTSRKIVIRAEGFSPEYDDRPIGYIIIFDFSNAYDGATCKENSFEEYYPRQIGDNNSTLCIDGYREKYMRRKQDQACFVNKLFEDVRITHEPCQCTKSDFECAMGFKVSSKDKYICIPDHTQLEKICKDKNEKINLDDKVLIDGNKCDLGEKKFSDFIVNQSIDCSKYQEQVITVDVSKIQGDIARYSFFKQSSATTSDLILQTIDNHIYVSKGECVSFVKVPIPDKIFSFYIGGPKEKAIIVTNEFIYVSNSGYGNFVAKKVPVPPNVQSPRSIVFYPLQDLFIWFGREESCDETRECQIVPYLAQYSGEAFFRLKVDNVETCDFERVTGKRRADPSIFCSVLNSDNTKKLVSLDVYSTEPQVILPHIVGYNLTGNFLVATAVNEKGNNNFTLQDKVTSDGEQFVDSDFPHDFLFDPQKPYTILDFKSKAIFKYVTTSLDTNFEYGAILKSSKDTSYVHILDAVNRNHQGYVDYEQMEDGLEGVLISNVVVNTDDRSRTKKLLQTVISHNDGVEWNLLSAPVTDSNNQNYKCQGPKCHLHLHGPTERTHYRDSYSSGFSTGFLIRSGNVGEYLQGLDKSSIFLSKDAGVSWKEIKQGNYIWEYADHGTILVLVNRQEETDTLLYSLNEGETWISYKFSDEKVKALDLVTVPSNTLRKFVLFAREESKSTTLAFSIDFTRIHSRQCQLDLDNPGKDDYEYWTPLNSNAADGNDESRCFFGQEVKYLRRAKGHDDCFIGNAPFKDGVKMVRKCNCTGRDYECDYNYYRNITTGNCTLIQGLTQKDMKNQMCNKPNVYEYYIPTGYRKILISSCQDGEQLDNWKHIPCPGKRRKSNEHHSITVDDHINILAIFVLFALFSLVVWSVYDRGIRRNGGYKRFRQIQLGDSAGGFSPIENNMLDAIVNRIVRGCFAVTASFTTACSKALAKIDPVLERMTLVLFAQETNNHVHMTSDFNQEQTTLLEAYDVVDDELQDDTRLNQTFTAPDSINLEQQRSERPLPPLPLPPTPWQQSQEQPEQG